ncbi:MAG: MBL fold metallo-hydrolase [Nanoarchaeota archaeon]|nr:MBL fold metallo-hydrolase [Nanoarchaeota archaeon]
MNKVKILIEGYAKETDNGWKANSSVTLIISNGKKMIADPGCNREKLIESLKKEGLSVDDIDYVLLTHGHPDHTVLAGIFKNAKIIDELYVYDKDLISQHNGVVPGTDVRVIRTPGHKEEHCSFVIPTPEGTYVVAGDVFWWTEDQKQEVDINKPDNDPEHTNMEKLIASRKKILEIADFVIPGHGKVFKTNR